MQISRKDCDRVILQIEFEFFWTELLDQSLDFSRIPLGHVTNRVRKVGLVLFQ